MRLCWHSTAIIGAGERRGERLRAAHAAEAGGQDPVAVEVAAEMLAAHLGEGLVGALDDALRADVDPAAGGHLAVHHQALPIELVEVLPGGPGGDQVGVGDQHPRRVLVGRKTPTGLPDWTSSVSSSSRPERLDDRVVPAQLRAARPMPP